MEGETLLPAFSRSNDHPAADNWAEWKLSRAQELVAGQRGRARIQKYTNTVEKYTEKYTRGTRTGRNHQGWIRIQKYTNTVRNYTEKYTRSTRTGCKACSWVKIRRNTLEKYTEKYTNTVEKYTRGTRTGCSRACGRVKSWVLLEPWPHAPDLSMPASHSTAWTWTHT